MEEKMSALWFSIVTIYFHRPVLFKDYKDQKNLNWLHDASTTYTNTHIKRQVTWHDCLPSLPGDGGDGFTEKVYGVRNKIFIMLQADYRAHCKENPIYVFLFWELRGLSPSFHIHVSVRDLYIPRMGPHICCSRIDRLVLEIYKYLTDIWV